MQISGNVKVHKSDGMTKAVSKAEVLSNGSLAIWGTENIDGEPDIIVSEDMWERVEREDHSWRRSAKHSYIQEAKERDDIDEEKVDKYL